MFDGMLRVVCMCVVSCVLSVCCCDLLVLRCGLLLLVCVVVWFVTFVVASCCSMLFDVLCVWAIVRCYLFVVWSLCFWCHLLLCVVRYVLFVVCRVACFLLVFCC